MLLSDKDIKIEIEKGNILIEGDGEIYLGPSSVDLHLDNFAKVLTKEASQTIDFIFVEGDSSKSFTERSGWDSIVINPGEFYILSTIEKITLGDDIAAFVQGRSSIARLGINIHAAGFVDPGFSGNITLEVTNFTSIPIVIPKNTRICQLVFQYTCSPCDVPYNKKKDSKYMNQKGPTLTGIHKDYGNN